MNRGGRRVNFGSGGSYRPDYQAPQKQRHISKLIKPVLALIAGIVVLYGLLFSPIFEVRAISVSGNEQLTNSELSTQIRTIMAGSFLGDNAIFVNPTQLARELRSRNYQLEQVSIEKSLLGGLRVKVVEQKATIQWRSGSSVFVLSGNGVAYAQLEQEDKTLPLVVDSTNLPVKTGQKVVPSSFVQFVSELSTKLSTLSLKPVTITVPETTTELAVKTNRGFVMKLDTTRDLDSQIADYRAVAAKKITPKEYIDLRIAGKVFYK